MSSFSTAREKLLTHPLTGEPAGFLHVLREVACVVAMLVLPPLAVVLVALVTGGQP